MIEILLDATLASKQTRSRLRLVIMIRRLMPSRVAAMICDFYSAPAALNVRHRAMPKII